MSSEHTYFSAIWNETPSENPYYASECTCHGYDVFGDILQNASLPEYLYLLLTGERLDPKQTLFFERVLIALAHPGMRDPSVRAAMNAGVGGSRAGAAMMAAIAVGAGQAGGAHELRLSLQICKKAKQSIPSWIAEFKNVLEDQECDVWLELETVPGFDPHQTTASPLTLQVLTYFASLAGPESQTAWLLQHYKELESNLNYGLNFIGTIAATLADLNISSEMAEYLFLFARLPGAATQAQEARELGFKKFPFFHNWVHLTNDIK